MSPGGSGLRWRQKTDGLPGVLTEDAERDLSDIVTFVAKNDSPRSAEYVLGRILDIADSLAIEPTRGSTPKELRALGDREYRQVFFKPIA